MPADRRMLRTKLRQRREEFVAAYCESTWTGREGKEGVALQASNVSETKESGVEYKTLAEHLGVDLSKVAIGHGFRGRGLFASCSFPAFREEVVFKVPLTRSALCIPDSTPEAMEFARALYAESCLPNPLIEFAVCTETNQAVRLAVLLHWQSRHGLQRSLNAALLPNIDEYTNALLLSEDAISELQDTNLQQMIMDLRAEAESWHNELLRNLHLQTQPYLVPELPDFLLALSHVSSRTFSCRIGSGRVSLMVPIADLMNHDFDPCCNFTLLVRGKCLEVYTRQATKVGDELCISYGEELDNYQLQTRYGFIVPGNRNDSINLPCDLVQQCVAASSGMGIDTDQLCRSAKHLCATTYAQDAVGQRRIEAATATLKAACWSGAASPAEAAALAAIAYKAHLESFATTVNDDVDLLSQGSKGSLAAAVRFRLERKLLTRAALDLVIATRDSYKHLTPG